MTNNASYRKQSRSTQHFTPNKYIESARLVMGSIDLDPASCDNANKYFVKATNYFTEVEDGLTKTWFGNVFCNPPYKRGVTKLWIEKILNQYDDHNIEQAILLVNAVPERSWFLPLFDYPICFTNHRIKFFDEFLDQKDQPEYGNAFVFISNINHDKFYQEFKQHGNVVQRYK